jgi:hypothetical protein
MTLLSQIVDVLESRAESLRLAGDLSLAFAAWANPTSVSPEELRQERDRCLAVAGAQRRYFDVASLGFLYQRLPGDEQVRERIVDGLNWMAGRSIRVEGNYADFCGDSLALLGMAIGLNATQNDVGVHRWLKTILQADVGKETEWDASIRVLARCAIGDVSSHEILAEVKLLGFSKGILKGSLVSSDAERLITRLKISTISKMSDPEACSLLAAFKYLEGSQPLLALQTPNIAAVALVLSNLKNGLTRWTWEAKAKTTNGTPRKWHIDNEYHVQNLLWCILRPLFPEAKEEEYKSAVGKVHPRLDIVLPSLRLIIEAKFWRRRDSSKEMVREIAEDSGLYLTVDKPYDAILPVIWDDSRRIEEHDSLRQALMEIDGIVAPVIIARPGLMDDESSLAT